MTTAPPLDAKPSPVNEAQFAALKAEIRAYVDDEGERWGELIESEHQVPVELWSELRERGYLRLAAPVSLGGRGLPFARYLELIELFARPHASLRMIVHVANGLWRAMLPFANADQLERFVRAQVSGELKVAFTLTEPDAGSGADIKCSVTRRGDTYYLSGQKHLITFGCSCDYLLLFARLEGSHGYDGTLALMVPSHGEGIDNQPMPESMGVVGTDHAHLTFKDAPVPVANRLGEEGEGLEVALGGFLVPSRISVAMTCVGLAGHALDLAVERARRRETFGKPLAARQAIAFKLAEMATDLEAARRLTLHAAATWEQNPHEGVADSSMAKLFATEMLQRVTDGALQVFGGIGYFKSPIERIYRDARAQRFEEGTVEVQKQTIARVLLG